MVVYVYMFYGSQVHVLLKFEGREAALGFTY